MTGWIVIANVWHYARGDHAICGIRILPTTVTLKDPMTPGLPNCEKCERIRRSEVNSYVETNGR